MCSSFWLPEGFKGALSTGEGCNKVTKVYLALTASALCSQEQHRGKEQSEPGSYGRVSVSSKRVTKVSLGFSCHGQSQQDTSSPFIVSLRYLVFQGHMLPKLIYMYIYI